MNIPSFLLYFRGVYGPPVNQIDFCHHAFLEWSKIPFHVSDLYKDKFPGGSISACSNRALMTRGGHVVIS